MPHTHYSHNHPASDGSLWRVTPTRPTCGDCVASDATLIVMEQDDGPYEPVGIGWRLTECLDLIAKDYHRRKPENDDLCPESYALWNRDAYGHYRRDATITKA
jgi:hypothetical protein